MNNNFLISSSFFFCYFLCQFIFLYVKKLALLLLCFSIDEAGLIIIWCHLPIRSSFRCYPTDFFLHHFISSFNSFCIHGSLSSFILINWSCFGSNLTLFCSSQRWSWFYNSSSQTHWLQLSFMGSKHEEGSWWKNEDLIHWWISPCSNRFFRSISACLEPLQHACTFLDQEFCFRFNLTVHSFHGKLTWCMERFERKVFPGWSHTNFWAATRTRSHTKLVTDFFSDLKILWEELDLYLPLPTCTCRIKCTCEAMRNARSITSYCRLSGSWLV